MFTGGIEQWRKGKRRKRKGKGRGDKALDNLAQPHLVLDTPTLGWRNGPSRVQEDDLVLTVSLQGVPADVGYAK